LGPAGSENAAPGDAAPRTGLVGRGTLSRPMAGGWFKAIAARLAERVIASAERARVRAERRPTAEAMAWAVLPPLAIFGAIGVAVTIAVAVSCAAFARVEPLGFSEAPVGLARRARLILPGASPAGFSSRWRGFGVREDRIYLEKIPARDRDVFADPPEFPTLREVGERFAGALDDEPSPGSRDLYAIDSDLPHLIRVRAGWPIACLGAWRYPWKGLGADEILGRRASPVRGVVPGTPLPGALLSDAAVFGGVLWVAWASPRFIIRISRKDRGMCTGCGYALGPLLKCPRCGRVVGAARAQESDADELAGDETVDATEDELRMRKGAIRIDPRTRRPVDGT